MRLVQYTVAISSDFFKAYAKLPKQVQSKVYSMVVKFRENPEQPGLNYEKLNYIDSKLVSLRVNDMYRCIVMRSEGVYVMLWVDAHDDAYTWARKRQCVVDTATGVLQVLVVKEQAAAAQTLPAGKAQAQATADPAQLLCPWATYPEERFEKLGIPVEYRQALRTLKRDDVEQYAGCFSDRTWECLHFLLDGDPWEEVEAILGEDAREKSVDKGDYKAALHNPGSRSHFWVDPEEDALENALKAPLEQWRIFLHPTQYALVERDWNGPVRVLGGAGTGKTVVAMHRARWLASRCPRGEKILFTTFSTTLAEDLRQNMEGLCSQEEKRRIEITNLDKWVYAYLKRENFSYSLCQAEEAETIWAKVVPHEGEFDRAFCQDEWKQVIQAQGITTFEEYIRAPRTGRGRGITRAQRQKLWPIFEDFRIHMRGKQLLEPEDALRLARERVVANGKPLYWSVVVDETQDLSGQALKLLRSLVGEGKNDLFVVGDGHQRIYGKPVSLKSCGIAITGRARRLRINYRTTEEIRKHAAAYLQGVHIDDLDGGADGSGQYISLMHGPEPVRRECPSFEERLRSIRDIVAQLHKEGVDAKDICLTLASNREIERYAKALAEDDVPTFSLVKDVTDKRTEPGIRLATRHRVKGLEFTAVILADTRKETFQEEDVKNRFLRYVAATRARQYLYILS